MFKVQDADKLQILAAMRGSLASHGIGSVIDGVFLRFDSSHLDKFLYIAQPSRVDRELDSLTISGATMWNMHAELGEIYAKVVASKLISAGSEVRYFVKVLRENGIDAKVESDTTLQSFIAIRSVDESAIKRIFNENLAGEGTSFDDFGYKAVSIDGNSFTCNIVQSQILMTIN